MSIAVLGRLEATISRVVQFAEVLYMTSSNQSRAALGTKHHKEQVIAPLFLKELGLTVEVPANFDSDAFGTFTLEIPRLGTQKETAVTKARAAMAALGLNVGIASEGAFGFHPLIPFGTASIEMVVFVDDTHNLEIFGFHVAAAPYVQSAEVSSLAEVLAFAEGIDFPAHGIVLRPAQKKYQGMVKGIVTHKELEAAAATLLSAHKTIWLETDLQAHMNASRMKNIEHATRDLIENIKRQCPACKVSGFHKTGSKPGLPCETCSRPTDLPVADLYICNGCGYQHEAEISNSKKTASASNCDYCNP